MVEQPEGGNGDRGLRRVDADAVVPFAAMAEALRANAEALQRIDRSQQKIAESIEKGDKAGQVVTSTRALNDTFRGLSEIQRGLLEAVVSERGRGKGLPFAFAAIAILAGLLGFLLYERWTATDTVPRVVFEAARKTSEERAERIAELRSTMNDSSSTLSAIRQQLSEANTRAETAERERDAAQRKSRQLDEDLKAKESRLQNYLRVKDIADRAGTVEVRNSHLERENRELGAKLERAEKERDRLLVLMGEKKIEDRGTDPELIKKAAREKGVIDDGARPESQPGVLTPSIRRRVRRQLNGLLQQAPGEEAYELISFNGLKDGRTLIGVKLGHYRNAQLLNSLHGKELEIWVDPAKDTAELRIKGGFIAATGKKIPLDADGHSIFLKDVGLKAWQERALIPVEIGKGGRLTLRTSP